MGHFDKEINSQMSLPVVQPIEKSKVFIYDLYQIIEDDTNTHFCLECCACAVLLL